MVERRACSPWTAMLLTGLVCLSVWQIIGCPGPPSTAYIVSPPPAYSLLTAANASSAEPPYDLERLPPDDYTRLMNLHDFRFTMLGGGAGVCNDSRPPLLLVLVHSAPSNIDKRAAIRATWGAPRDSVRLVFLVGAARPALELQLQAEQRRHADLVQGSFRDAYRNMTYKHVMALKYAAYHCPRARYVLKTDDDVFVNIRTMMAFLSVELSAWGARRLLFCDTLWVSYAKRSYRSKWRVSYKEYRDRKYPPYCAGWAILYSPDVAFALYREAQRSDYFWIDDVLVTGILAERAHVEHTQVSRPLLLESSAVAKLLQDNHTASDFSFLYGPLNIHSDGIRALWKVVDGYHQRHPTTAVVAAAALAASAAGVTDQVSE